jgi:hypothetical protein
MNGGRLELEIVDVMDARLTEPVDIELRHRVLNEHVRVDNANAQSIIAIQGLRTEPQGLYILQISAPSYRPISRFVTIPSTGTQRARVALPIRHDRAKAMFPSYDQLDTRVRGLLERSANVRGHAGLTGKALYDAMSDVAKAGLLNIAIKSFATAFRDGADLLPHVTLLDALGDRCFVEVPRALIDQMPQLVDGDIFRPVNGSLHELPDGMMAAGSFKTSDAFGNLQVTLFQNDTHCRADIDIDDAAGLGHVFQVARNHITQQPTHPFNIQQLLIAHQHLDPGYRLVPHE